MIRWLLLTIFLSASLTLAQPAKPARPPEPVKAIYRCLFLRDTALPDQMGAETLDLLFWYSTQHLLTGNSHAQAMSCLEDFLKAHREKEIRDPSARAILQHDLWALFDWTAHGDDHPRERRELQMHLAEVLRRLSLDEQAIRSLPDTYANTLKLAAYPAAYNKTEPRQTFLPPDLLRPGGPWVCINSSPTTQTVPIHLEGFGGRSRFLVLLNLPGGRQATFRYLHELYEFGRLLQFRNASAPIRLLDLDAPQFPAGTQVALVRQMVLFDRDGKLVMTPVTESVQIRVFHSVTPGSPYMNYINGPSSRDQDFFEFRLDKKELLFGGAGVLKAISPEETEQSTFMSHGIDPFEMSEPNRHQEFIRPGRIMEKCTACHADSGVHSLQSRFSLIPPNNEMNDKENGDPNYGALYWETEKTLTWKRNRYDWGLLNGYWNSWSAGASPATMHRESSH